MGMALSPDGRYAYVTHILGRYQFPVTYLERTWVNTNAMTVIDVPTQRFVNTVLLDDPEQGAADPHGVVCTQDGKTLVVAHAGTHELSVIDRVGLHYQLSPAQSARHFMSSVTSAGSGMTSGTNVSEADDVPNDLGFMTGLRRRIKLDGHGPRGLAVVGSRVFVVEYFSDSIGIVDIKRSRGKAVTSIPLGPDPGMTQARWGERCFHDASRSHQRWHSCATCHVDQARSVGLNWGLLNDGIANPKNTKSLLLTHETPPAMATGVRKNAESAIQSGIYYIQFAFPRHKNVKAMGAYLQSLHPVESPYLVNGRLSPAAQNGQRLFEQAGCSQCHGGRYYTHMGKHNVGTAAEVDDHTAFDTPTLVEVWRTAPYLHDGRATTVKEVVTTFNPTDLHGKTSDLKESEVADLVEYVLTR
jgi:hypothetical protein